MVVWVMPASGEGVVLGMLYLWKGTVVRFERRFRGS